MPRSLPKRDRKPPRRIREQEEEMAVKLTRKVTVADNRFRSRSGQRSSSASTLAASPPPVNTPTAVSIPAPAFNTVQAQPVSHVPTPGLSHYIVSDTALTPESIGDMLASVSTQAETRTPVAQIPVPIPAPVFNIAHAQLVAFAPAPTFPPDTPPGMALTPQSIGGMLESAVTSGPTPAAISMPVSVPQPGPIAVPMPLPTPEPISAPVARPGSPTLTWEDVERPGTLEVHRSVVLDERCYLFNDFNILQPGGVLILLKVLTFYFDLADTLKLLHLQRHEIRDIEKLLWPDMRDVEYHIGELNVRDAKRILMAHVREGEVLDTCLRRLDIFKGREFSLEDIERRKFRR